MNGHHTARVSSMLMILTLCAEGTTHARGATAQLSYAVGSGVRGCPDEATLKREVAIRLGSDPWHPNAARTVVVIVSPADGGLQARVKLRQEDGRILGTRILRAATGECRELGAAMALAISIAIDPSRASRPPVNESASKTTRRPMVVHKPEDDSGGPLPQPSSPELAVSLGGLLALGTAPNPTGGLVLQAALRWTTYWLAVEGRFDFPASRELQTGQISALLSGGSLLGCARHRMLFGCAVFTAAALRGSGHGLIRPQQVTLPYLAAGLRGGVEYAVISRWSLRAHAELLTPFGRIRLTDSSTGDPFWTTSVVSASFALSAVGTFF